MSFAAAEQIADAVLWEGYVLYPYRASAAKNHLRWQFGVLFPRDFAEQGRGDHWRMRTECLIEPEASAPVAEVRVRFLHLQVRTVERLVAADTYTPVSELDIDGRTIVSWDEAVERTWDLPRVQLEGPVFEQVRTHLDVPGEQQAEPLRDRDGTLRGRVVRRRWPLAAQAVLSAEPIDGLLRLRIEVDNAAAWGSSEGSRRDRALRLALLGAHTLIHVDGGMFVSLTDPPEDARTAADACDNLNAWPVLAGAPQRRDLLLSSPIILPEYPQVAPESPGSLFDATEIDELLTLRVMTLSDEEKAEARATDEHARAVIDRSEMLPAAHLERLHGALRTSGLAGGENGSEGLFDPSEPYWAPEAAVAPEDATVTLRGVAVGRGSRVRLHPGPRGDTLDAFLADRTARVHAVYESVDDETFVAVTVEDDPAADLHRGAGRFLYFRPEELEPLDAAGEPGP